MLLAGEAVADSLAAVDRLAQAPARIEPSIGGYWKWQDPQTLVFVPEEAFQPNTAYVVTLDKGFFRNQGLTLRGERDFQFTAAPFRLESFRLSRDRLPGVERRYLVRGFCRFSYPVDPRDLARYLDCRLDQRGAVDFALGSTAVSRNIELQIGPIEAGSRDEMLRVIIDGDLPAQVGGRALGEEIQRQLQIPAIERLEIRQANMRSQGEQAVVVIDFSEPVSIRELERKLTIEPEVADLRLTGDYREVRLEADWVFGQTYTLRLDASLASDSGLLLERDWQGHRVHRRAGPLVGDRRQRQLPVAAGRAPDRGQEPGAGQAQDRGGPRLRQQPGAVSAGPAIWVKARTRETPGARRTGSSGTRARRSSARSFP